VDSALGCAVKASRLAANVNAELLGRLKQWEELQHDMLSNLRTMQVLCQENCSLGAGLASATAAVTATAAGAEGAGAGAGAGAPGQTDRDESPASSGGRGGTCSAWPLDPIRSSELVFQMQQQTLLEISIYEVLRSEARGEARPGAEQDHDTSVTYLACFTYAPYLSESALNIVLEMQE